MTSVHICEQFRPFANHTLFNFFPNLSPEPLLMFTYRSDERRDIFIHPELIMPHTAINQDHNRFRYKLHFHSINHDDSWIIFSRNSCGKAASLCFIAPITMDGPPSSFVMRHCVPNFALFSFAVNNFLYCRPPSGLFTYTQDMNKNVALILEILYYGATSNPHMLFRSPDCLYSTICNKTTFVVSNMRRLLFRFMALCMVFWGFIECCMSVDVMNLYF